jgi:pyruvate, water dikinase
MHNVISLDKLNISHLDQVGGKNASLGEMIQNLTSLGLKVPGGFATTADAYREFLRSNKLDKKIYALLDTLDEHNIKDLTKISKQIHQWIMHATFPPEFIADVTAIFSELETNNHATFAVRSSATAEDLPNASFAGQQDSFLNVTGISNILGAIKKVYASLFNKRAIIYRLNNNFEHSKVAISAGIQVMVRSDVGASGVIFTIDTESGFDKVFYITASYGLGEAVVQGKVNPDEFYVYKPGLAQGKPAILKRNLGTKLIKTIYTKKTKQEATITNVKTPKDDQKKFCITDDTINILAKYAALIENHYHQAMDIEWAQDGITKEVFVVQARPETVKSQEKTQAFERYTLEQKGEIIVSGSSVGQKIGAGSTCIITDPKKMSVMQPGQILVADMTDPDWEPIMKIAGAIVTNRGGRTCHAAIVARELGVPAVVGCVNATTKIKNHEPITVSCAEGEVGKVYRGKLAIKIDRIDVNAMPSLPFKLYLNLADPNKAFAYQFLPNNGVGLVRLEFIINNMIGIHPKALLNFDALPKTLHHKIDKMIAAYSSPTEFYIEKIREGVATIAAAFYPKPIIVRFSDFKSNEYANLLGGKLYEPHEENPMIGFRGGSRYVSDLFADCFALECEAMKRVRSMGLDNVQVMLPFVRTVEEAKAVIATLAQNGLKREEQGLKIILMCEIPSNVLLAEEFLELCDGFSIGSNDLTQLTLGLDRDSNLVAHLFDERNAAVKKLLHEAIATCKRKGKYIGICGQAPSDYPELAKWLGDEGIESISLTPDSIVETWLYLAKNQGGSNL